MKLLWSDDAWEDYLYWQEIERGTVRRINTLLRDIGSSPFRGMGKPERLVGELRGWWSRRITGEHRLVYRVSGRGEDQRIEIMMCRYHYSRRP